MTGKRKDTVVSGNFHYDRKKKIHYDRKKKRYSRLSDGCAVLAITTGKKRYIRLSVGCAVLAITTRKKKIQSSVWRVVLLCQFLVLAITTGKKKFQSSLNLY